MQVPLLHIGVDPAQAGFDPHLQTPFVHVSLVPEQDATDAEHLQTSLVASQYAPVERPRQDEAVPHLQFPETHFSPDTLQASTVDEHLQMPFPLSAEASQNSPVVIPAQDATAEVHLQILLEASQCDPVDKPEQLALVPQ